MSATKLKEEVIWQFAVKVDAMEDETALKAVFEFLSSIKSGDTHDINLAHHSHSIKAKHSDVVEQLAK